MLHTSQQSRRSAPISSARRDRAVVTDLATVRAYRLKCQRLEQRTGETIGRVLSSIGYVSVPGGATPYLALKARSPRFTRAFVDAAVFETSDLAQIPFTRGTTVLAPAHDAPWLLSIAHRLHGTKTAPLRQSGLINDTTKGRLCDAIVRLLETGALRTDEIRARLPESLVVPLGAAARKLGFPTLFAVALRELQLDGLVVCQQRDRRLDRDGFEWALPMNPLGPPAERSEALQALAGRYFRAHAPASAAAFAHWAETTIGEARTAIVAAELVSVEVEGEREAWWLGADQLDDFLQFEPPTPERIAFVPFRDPSVNSEKDLVNLLGVEHRDMPLSDWRGRLVAGGGGHLIHHDFLLQGGRIAGIWEYQEDTRRIAWETFEPLSTRARRLADDMAQELASGISEELGSARFYAGEKEASFPSLEATCAAWSRTSQRRSK